MSSEEFDFHAPNVNTRAAAYFNGHPRYSYSRLIGHGAYGMVASALDSHTNTLVAIKRISQLNSTLVARRTLRELKLLRHFRGHPNVIGILDLFRRERLEGSMSVSSSSGSVIASFHSLSSQGNVNGGGGGVNGNPTVLLDEVFITQELQDCDLAFLIQNKQPFHEVHIKQFVYQMLCGLKALHSADVIHRDLKPGNLLWSYGKNTLKICDFGLARGIEEKPVGQLDTTLTNYVATRWYRPPEILLYKAAYGKPLDMWAVGCILAELLSRKVFLPGSSGLEQLHLILQRLGTPSDEVIGRIPSVKSIAYLKRLPKYDRKPLEMRFPEASPEALDLLDKFLKFDPAERITVEQALEHPYVQSVRNRHLEVTFTKFDFSFDARLNSIHELKSAILEELLLYRQLEKQSMLPTPVTPSDAVIINDVKHEDEEAMMGPAMALTDIKPLLQGQGKQSRFKRVEK